MASLVTTPSAPATGTESVESAPATESLPHASEEASTPDAVFDALWKRVHDAWDDDHVHAVLIRYALEQQQLPLLARRYSELRSDPERGERAKAKLAALVGVAVDALTATKTVSPKGPFSRWPFWVFAAVPFVGGCLYFLYKAWQAM